MVCISSRRHLGFSGVENSQVRDRKDHCSCQATLAFAWSNWSCQRCCSKGCLKVRAERFQVLILFGVPAKRETIPSLAVFGKPTLPSSVCQRIDLSIGLVRLQGDPSLLGHSRNWKNADFQLASDTIRKVVICLLSVWTNCDKSGPQHFVCSLGSSGI